MNIVKFKKEEFGTLTSIVNEETGTVMFVGKEVSDNWGHTNLTQAIKSAKLDNTEYKVIDLKKFTEFKKQLTTSGLVGQRASNIIMLTESGMYKLVLASNMEKSRPFRNWVMGEVLPSIRKKGYYSIADNKTEGLMLHSNTDIQKNNSKLINKKNFEEKGTFATIEYNKKSFELHTGTTPSKMKKIGKEQGLKSKDRSSGKEVLRHIKPELACAMSFTDSLVQKGFDLKTVSELSLKSAVPLFQGMIELGILPAELGLPTD